MGELSVNKRKNAIEMCPKIIPLMTEEEMDTLVIFFNTVCERIIKDVDD
jgi:hypothetical protein